MLGLDGKVVVNNKNNKQIIEKLQEWLDSLPEIVKQRESANVMAFVFFVELLNEKEKEKKVEGVDINVCLTDIFMPKEDFEEFKAGESVIGINVRRLKPLLRATISKMLSQWHLRLLIKLSFRQRKMDYYMVAEGYVEDIRIDFSEGYAGEQARAMLILEYLKEVANCADRLFWQPWIRQDNTRQRHC